MVYSATFSEELPAISGYFGIAISGIECTNDHCDDKCLAMKLGHSRVGLNYSDYFTAWFSDEGEALGVCPPDQLVSQIQCRGPWCDEIRLRCSPLNNDYMYSVFDTKVVQSEVFSTTEGLGVCPDHTKLVGIRCTNQRCGSLQLMCKYINVRFQLVDTLFWMINFSLW